MKLFYRFPERYLAIHWLLTLMLATALLVPSMPTSTSGDSITLLTGQTVRLNADGSPMANPSLWEGQLPNIPGGDLYAAPQNMLPLLGANLDPRLYDVTYLEANGYDDSASSTMPVIVQFADQAEAVAAVQRGTVEHGSIVLTHAFEYLPMASGYVRKSGPFVPTSLANSDFVTGIFLDGRDHLDLDGSLPLIGAPAARAKGLTGAGIKVAIVDTGIDANHPDLKGRIVAAADFSGENNPQDLHGHGTHVAGIVGGTGAASDGKYGGVAPGVVFINAKGLTRYGQGSDSGIMRAMEWAADQGARVVNMSLGGGPSDGTDTLSRAVNAITKKKNVLFVIAAGNSGPRQKVSSPAAADLALAVGAVDKALELASFSSRGPRLKDMAVKPEIVAPGVRITAPRANGTDDLYATYSGTSMATPMVAGAAALVFQLHPTWGASQVKNALISSAVPIGPTCSGTTACPGYVSAYDQGAGLVSLANIVQMVAYADPGIISFGAMKLGRREEGVVTIRNITDHALTLTVITRLHDAQGRVVAGLESRSQKAQIGAQGSLGISIVAQAPGQAGIYTGEVLFSGESGVVARATVGLVAEK